MTECRDCRDWKGCIGKDFFNYAEIQFCIHQVYWLIQHRETLRQGDWPTQTDDNPDSTYHTEASFAKVITIIAEVDERLKGLSRRVRDDLIDLIEAGISIENLSRTSRDALYYISGWNRKQMPFYQWRWQRKRRKSDDKISSEVIEVKT